MKKRDQGIERVASHFPDRKFGISISDHGSLWTVADYTKKGTDEASDKVIKVFNEGLYGPYYVNPKDKETRAAVADKLKRERNFLKEQYAAKLPDLLLQDRIIVAEDAIMMIEEKRDPEQLATLPDFFQSIAELPDDQREALLKELEIFVQITKQLAIAEHPDNSEFNTATPNLSVENLVISINEDGGGQLLLFDKNFVLPADHAIKRMFPIEKINALMLYYIEFQYLGKASEELDADPYYQARWADPTIPARFEQRELSMASNDDWIEMLTKKPKK